ncbi:MAG: SPOR domain-containing protein [Candidatus Acidiferrales bacterium]
MIQERRQYQRLVPDSPPSVYLGESKSGLLFDFSEGGFAVDGLPPKSRDPIFSVAFSLPGGGSYLRASAEVVWTNDLGRRTGLRFVDLTETSLQPLREWISASSFAPALPASEKQAVPPAVATRSISPPILPNVQQRPEEELARLRTALTSVPSDRLRRFRRRILVFLAVVIFAPAFVFLGHVLANRGYKSQLSVPQLVATAAAPSAQSFSKTVEPPSAAVSPEAVSPAAVRSVPVPLSFANPGFVLQVGAMTQESNADVMRKSLEQKNFPAFAVRSGTDRFYRVCVGPYANADSAEKIKDELEAQGFKAIVKHWSPD